MSSLKLSIGKATRTWTNAAFKQQQQASARRPCSQQHLAEAEACRCCQCPNRAPIAHCGGHTLSPFRCWCQEILPTSGQEILCALAMTPRTVSALPTAHTHALARLADGLLREVTGLRQVSERLHGTTQGQYHALCMPCLHGTARVERLR